MNPSMQPAIQHLFQVSTLEDVPREELERLTREHPCFGYGHFLLSRKLRAENDDRFLSVTQKASLHFSNPLWLQWMLDNAPESARMRVMRSEPAMPEALPTSREVTPVIDETAPTIAEAAPDTLFSHDAPEPLAIPEPAAARAEPDSHDPATGRIDTAGQTGPDIAEPAALSGETTSGWPEMESPQPPPQPAGHGPGETDPAWPKMDDPQASAAEILSDSIEKAKELRQSLLKINEDFVARTGHPIPTRESVREGDTQQEPIRDVEPPFVLDETDQSQREAAELGSPTPIHQADTADTPPEAGGDDRGSNIPNGPAVQADNAPLFEPLHTVDYFASQGIRLTPEDNPTDQLGRQLKSFTEWLRMMRRLPQKGREIIPDRVTEEAVQHFAAHSIEGKEVVTETMAEVLAKQGMPERARLVYEKLSLLDPDKSAYFAAKIEQLNPH